MSLLSRLAVQAARAYGILSSRNTNVPASYLVVAGGGGGGPNLTNTPGGGGGGAGGYRASTTTLSTLNTYTVTVGAGGTGATTGSLAGSDSVLSGTGITTITSTGGGRGGSWNPDAKSGGNGGSGGGAAFLGTAGSGNTPSTSPSQGSNGGEDDGDQAGGGGGGASATGGNASGGTGGSGGSGTASSITGSSVTYAGGGGGGGGNSGTGTAGSAGSGGGGAGGARNNNGSNGSANTGGGGGGGGGHASGGTYSGGSGGSGVVIISYTSATPKFVGGTLTTSGGNQIHTFTSSGTLSPLTPVTASYLVVAGGGGGGNADPNSNGGGGGAGGLLTSSTTIYSGATYVVTVGAGGAAVTNGSNSSLAGTGITTLTSTGGGAGGTLGGAGASGGSGGGAGGNAAGSQSGGTGTVGQGNNGGACVNAYSGGGGGGAGAAGSASNVSSGAGGAGTASSITGTSVTYAGGGGSNAGVGGSGGGGAGGGPATSGTTNLGGGGGGRNGTGTAASGGSGVVIISYAGSQVFNGGLVTSSGGNTIHTFNATGALTPLTNNLNNSLRFRASASAYLSRTPTLATNRRTWTLSMWVKRGALGASQFELFTAGTSGSNYLTFQFGADKLNFISETPSLVLELRTTQVFRDPSAWYHIVLAVDTTQATAANRLKLYVNGNQVTAFATATYPTQNTDLLVNSAVAHYFSHNTSGGGYFDGYDTDINFVDGQQLEPYYFGNNDAYGNWKPILYKGMYGTNGFYLPFSDTSALTTSSNVGLGKDFSNNGNYWATNNISITAGSTYDAMLDVPTNTSATVANYATLNPVYKAASQPTFSNANLTVAGNTANYQNSYSTIAVTSGKWYAEIVVTGTPNSANMIGVSNQIQLNYMCSNADILGTGSGGTGYGYYIHDGRKYTAGTASAYGNSIASGDIVGIALDLDNGKIWFSKNGTWQASGDPAAGTNAAFTGIASDTWSIGSTSYSTGATSFNHNFGQRPFTYTAPSGFVALNTFNLPTPTILQGNKYMDATLWTGNGADSNVIVNQGQFKPDFVWAKSRSNAVGHVLVDSVRGASKLLQSDTTGAEVTYAGVSSFNSNGFTVSATGAITGTNANAYTYAGWQWQAGQGSTSSNTSGSITSTVSVNTTAGFSVVTYTGTGSAATVGHGLGVAPSMIIVKNRTTAATSWAVYHTSLGNTNYLLLETTNASAASITAWNNTSPTSTVFSVGTGTSVNQNTNSMVAYCWAEIAGFSKFGSYTGNGSTDGPFVYTGFRPKYVMIKCSSAAGNDWPIIDTSRATYNAAGPELYADLSQAESTSNYIDIVSNGFKIRSTGGQVNTSATTYIYAAWAENPFNNSNAR